MQFLNGHYNLSMRLDGQDFNLTRDGILNKLVIVESVTDLLPTMQLTLGIDYQWTDERPIHDGSLIEISIQSGKDDDAPVDWMPFRAFSTQVTQMSGSDLLDVTGYYDAVPYIISADFSSVFGSSSTVAKEVAKESGLNTDIDTAADSQAWIRNGLTGGTWLRQVAKHAYLNDTSAFASAVTRNGELRYYNLSNRKKKSADWEFIETDNAVLKLDDNQVKIMDSSYSSRSGLANKWRAYGFYANNFNLIDEKVNKIEIGSVTKMNKYLSINKDLDNPTRYVTGPLNIGNTHDRFYQAAVQNARYLAAYSVQYKAIVDQPKDINLLDRVRVISQRGNESVRRDSITGEYFVGRIVTVIEGSNLTYTYFLVSDGINSEQNIVELYS